MLLFFLDKVIGGNKFLLQMNKLCLTAYL